MASPIVTNMRGHMSDDLESFLRDMKRDTRDPQPPPVVPTAPPSKAPIDFRFYIFGIIALVTLSAIVTNTFRSSTKPAPTDVITSLNTPGAVRPDGSIFAGSLPIATTETSVPGLANYCLMAGKNGTKIKNLNTEPANRRYTFLFQSTTGHTEIVDFIYYPNGVNGCKM